MPACTHCGQDTAWNADVCPNCGAQPPHGGAQARGALVKILGTILAIWFLGSLFHLW
jgi:uncharacterized membrane protein YvbJ